jgi:hypothetical protein
VFEHPINFISMFVPLIIGILRYNTLYSGYKVLFYYICFAIIDQIIFSFFKFSPEWNNIFNYLSHISLLPLRLYICILWSDIKKKNTLLMWFIIISVLFILIEVYWIGLHEYRASIALSISSLICISFIVFIIVDLIKQQGLYKTKRSMMLFMMPFVVARIYSTSIDIFMSFLYNENTTGLFIKLYDIYLYLSVFYYLSIAISLWLAPVKEEFI